jgi:asparagine synthase (glutamine-hydrolysing)
MALRGADPETVRRALRTEEPLPGTGGFAGDLDGRLLRDVLGRQPVFFERESIGSSADDGSESAAGTSIGSTAGDAVDWDFDPRGLSEPVRLPAGGCLEGGAVRQVWSLPDPEPNADERAAVDAVRDAIEQSVREVDAGGLAVGFSGGVDSAAVAAGVPEAPCYVVGFEGAGDLERARRSAEAMDRDLRLVELAHADLERAVPEVVAAIGRTGAMDVAIGLTLFLAAERAAADGFVRFAVGQGVDELFGGYAKIAAPGDHSHADAETVRGARRESLLTLPDGLERDVLAMRAAGVEPVMPLVQDRVVRAALPLSGSLLATPERRKIAFRRATDGLLPASVRRAEKSAAQYGSYVARELDRLARRAGFKRRMDDHVGQYVASLVEDAGVDALRIRDPPHRE